MPGGLWALASKLEAQEEWDHTQVGTHAHTHIYKHISEHRSTYTQEHPMHIHIHPCTHTNKAGLSGRHEPF